MKMLTRLMALMMALLMCGACALADADDVMLTVNGTPVTRADYEGYLATLQDYYTNAGYDVADPSIAPVLQQFALQTSVEYAALDQQIAALGLALTDDEKAAAEAEAKAQWEAVLNDGLSYYGMTAESTEEERATMLLSVLAELESMGYTEASYIEETLMYAGYDKLFDHLTRGVTVADEDVLAHFNSLVEADKAQYEGNVGLYEQTQYYNEMYATYTAMGYGDFSSSIVDIFYTPSGYRAVNHILLIPEDEALVTAYSDLQAAYEEQQLAAEEGAETTGEKVTEAQVEEARLAILAAVQPTIDEINKKLAEGADFNALVLEYGQDPGMSDAAAVAEGYQVHLDSIMWDPAFTNAAMSIEQVGGVADPIVGMNGVHIVHYDHDVAGGAVELSDDLKTYLTETLLATKQNEAYSAAIGEWINQATIEYSDEAKTILGITE